MNAKQIPGFLSSFLLFLLLAQSGFASVGKALEEAMKSRSVCSVDEVVRNYRKAVAEAGNAYQKSNILGLLADFLMEKKAWERAIEIDEEILAENIPTDKAGAYYGMAQAYLLSGQADQARAICVKLKAECPNNTMEEYAGFMKDLAPGSIHATLAGFLTEAPSENGVSPVSDPEIQSPSLPEKQNASIGRGLGSAEFSNNRVNVGVRGWNSALSGSIEAKGMSLDLSDGTDIGAQAKTALYGGWKFSPRDQLRLEYSQFDHHGRLTRGVSFDGLAYAPGTAVEFRTGFFDVGLSRLLDDSQHGSWKLLYGMKWSRMFMRLAQPMAAGTRVGELTTNFSVPYLGIEGEAKLSNNVTLNGSLKYFSLSGSNGSGRLTDLDVAMLFGRDYAEATSATEWYATLGYRFFLLHGEADGDSAEIGYSGPTFGVESRF